METKYEKLPEFSVANCKKQLKHAPYLGDELIFYKEFSEGDEVPPFFFRVKGVHMILCLQGTLRYTVEGRSYEMKPNDFLIINDNMIVSEYSGSYDCKFLSLLGTRMFFHEMVADIRELSLLFLFIHNNPLAHLSDAGVAKFREYYNSIQNHMIQSRHRFRRSVIISLFKSMIFDLADELWNQVFTNTAIVQPRVERIFKQFISLVEDNFRVQRRVGWYAAEMGISPKYLSETVKAVSNDTPNKWIDNYVVLELCSLLRNTTLNIKEITEKMNFPNQSFLGKYFKEHMGVSPSEFRQKRD